ncbi:MAG: HlyD family type I secretion periplasmic adaptor subunit [Pseudomonadota bacterium]
MSSSSINAIHWQRDAKTDSSPIIKFGFWSIGAVFVVFLFWATVFPLSSAVVTLGSLTSDGRNKMVQHPTGGRVAAIMVREGALVDKGAPLITLDGGSARADLTQLEARFASLSALKDRLDAERSGGRRAMDPAALLPLDGSNETALLDELPLRGTEANKAIATGQLMTGSTQPVIGLRGIAGAPFVLPVAKPAQPAVQPAPSRPDGSARSAGFNSEIYESERAAFEAGRQVLAQQMAALSRKIDTLTQKRRGLLARVKSQQSLLAMNRRELNRMRPLARDGYVARNRLNEREGTVLELEGTISSLELDAVGVEHQIEEVRVQMRKTAAESADTASQQYAKIVGELAELSDKLVAARSAVENITVRAPIGGRVIKLATTTVGGVLGGGEVIGEIVPSDAPIIVQARVEPADVDFVKVGSTAQVIVTAFSRTLDDTLDGEVMFVGPDAETDEKTGNTFFTVRLSVKPSKDSNRSRIADLQPGMQAEVYINTGARTFLSYVARPLTDSFKRAFRER